METPLIELKGITKSFDSLCVLDGIDLAVEEGMVTTIIGRSGVGKSVLLKHRVGLIEPDRGEILFHGKDVLAMSRRERSRMKSRFSYMFQHLALFDSMTIFENIALPLREHTDLPEPVIREMVSRLSAASIRDALPGCRSPSGTASAVGPPSGSEAKRPLTGPGAGTSPRPKASSSAPKLSASRSS